MGSRIAKCIEHSRTSDWQMTLRMLLSLLVYGTHTGDDEDDEEEEEGLYTIDDGKLLTDNAEMA